MEGQVAGCLEIDVLSEKASTGIIGALNAACTSSESTGAWLENTLKCYLSNDRGLSFSKTRLLKTLLHLVREDAFAAFTGAEWVLPAILKLLNFPDPDFQILGCLTVAKYAKLLSEEALKSTIPLLVELLNFDSSSGGISFKEVSALAIKSLAKIGHDLSVIIVQSGVFPTLLYMASQSDEKLQLVGLQALRELVLSPKSNQELLVQAGGLQVMLTLIPSSVASVKCLSAEILGLLAGLRSVRRAITNRSGVASLVEAILVGHMASKTRAAHALGLLAFTKRFRRMIGCAGGIGALVQLLRDGDETAKLVAGNSLGILSACVDHLHQVTQAGAIPLYLSLLEGGNPLGKDIAEDAFCILAVSEDNALVIMEHLVRILCNGSVKAKAAAADVIWDLSSYRHGVSVVMVSGAIPLLVAHLRDDDDEVRENVSGAIGQLTYNEDDRHALAEAGVIPILIELLQDQSLEVKSNVTEALHSFADDPSHRSEILDALAVLDLVTFDDNTLTGSIIKRIIEHRGVATLSLEPEI